VSHANRGTSAPEPTVLERNWGSPVVDRRDARPSGWRSSRTVSYLTLTPIGVDQAVELILSTRRWPTHRKRSNEAGLCPIYER
jgi:hypothetical protein